MNSNEQFNPAFDMDDPEEGDCDVCGAQIHFEEGQWFHTRIEDGSHEPVLKGRD